ncbi:MAG: hypothetical protein KDA92_04080, partial [Planctomycetales bacterium]|nr:hypothetical protein [Planctomycetales bacterium]
KVLIRAMLALTNLLGDGGDAEAYSLQMIDKQEQIIAAGGEQLADGEENPKAAYQRVALAPYLRGVLREATHRDYDDAQRSFATVVSWQPEFSSGAGDLSRAVYGHHSEPGNGVLYVFTLTGRGPYKEEVVEAPTSQSLLIAGEILNQLGKQTVPPNIAPVKVPQIVARDNLVQTVAVVVDQQHVGYTETITDVTSLAINQYAAVMPQIIARAVARRIVKKGFVYGAKEMADISKGTLSGTALDLAGVAWEMTESADTRCWGLLPDKIQVLRIELPQGQHDVALAAATGQGQPSPSGLRQTVEIRDGRNTYVLAVFPDMQPVGQMLISN